LRSCDEKYKLRLNPKWIDAVAMYHRSVATNGNAIDGWTHREGTSEHICNSYERNIMVNLQGTAQLCYYPAFSMAELSSPGEEVVMRVGCLCISENFDSSKVPPREQMFGIAAAAFADQTHADKFLVVITDRAREDAETLERIGDTRNRVVLSDLRGQGTVCQRMDQGYDILAKMGCDVLCVWDDDDWKHPTFLSEVVKQFSREPYEERSTGGRKYINPADWLITAYKWGLYVNARHLYAEDPSKARDISSWGYWGCSLAFRRAAWEQHNFSGMTFLGYDPEWCRLFDKEFWAPPIDVDPFKVLSFCHGGNVYHHCRGGGFDLKPWLSGISSRSRDEMYRVRNYLINNNIEPPQVNKPY